MSVRPLGQRFRVLVQCNRQTSAILDRLSMPLTIGGDDGVDDVTAEEASHGTCRISGRQFLDGDRHHQSIAARTFHGCLPAHGCVPMQVDCSDGLLRRGLTLRVQRQERLLHCARIDPATTPLCKDVIREPLGVESGGDRESRARKGVGARDRIVGVARYVMKTSVHRIASDCQSRRPAGEAARDGVRGSPRPSALETHDPDAQPQGSGPAGHRGAQA